MSFRTPDRLKLTSRSPRSTSPPRRHSTPMDMYMHQVVEDWYNIRGLCLNSHAQSPNTNAAKLSYSGKDTSPYLISGHDDPEKKDLLQLLNLVYHSKPPLTTSPFQASNQRACVWGGIRGLGKCRALCAGSHIGSSPSPIRLYQGDVARLPIAVVAESGRAAASGKAKLRGG
jgi:hypothetical protein